MPRSEKLFQIISSFAHQKEIFSPARPAPRLEADEKRKRSWKISCNEGKSEENGKLNNNNFSHETANGERRRQ
jgi:hypothetical protein